MKQTLLFTVLTLTFMLSSVSCEGQRAMSLGKWNPMQWTSATAFTAEMPHQIEVGSAGDTIVLTCSNYEIWRVATEFRNDTISDFTAGTAPWFTAVGLDHTLTIVIGENQGDTPRELKVRCRTGNVADYFHIIQWNRGH